MVVHVYIYIFFFVHVLFYIYLRHVYVVQVLRLIIRVYDTSTPSQTLSQYSHNHSTFVLPPPPAPPAAAAACCSNNFSVRSPALNGLLFPVEDRR